MPAHYGGVSLMPFDMASYLALDLSNINDEYAIALLGELINHSTDHHVLPGLQLALTWSESIRGRDLDHDLRAYVDYFEANAWTGIACCENQRQPGRMKWSGPVADAKEKAILLLRQAKQSEAFESLPSVTRCQILTNLGIAMKEVGRFGESIEYFDDALTIDPQFGMAWANRGCALAEYSTMLPHFPHPKGACATLAFLRESAANIQHALRVGVEPHARELFQGVSLSVEERLTDFDEESLDLDSHPLGDSEAERSYRRWCLARRLFCNPLNDVGSSAAAACDNLHLPSIVVPIGSSDYFVSFYNQIKQEFVSARYMLFQGEQLDSPHFSDLRVSLVDTWDYSVYGLSIEMAKIALRTAYSLLDKIAFYLNAYMGLAVPAHLVNFRTIWYRSQRKGDGLKPQFEGRENWGLRGLYWMAKDLYASDQGFQEALEPVARYLSLVRNHAEHKFLKCHDQIWMNHSTGENPSACLPPDSLLRIGADDLKARSLRLLKLARSAMIYLSYTVYAEEAQKARGRTDDEKVLQIPTEWLEDERKAGPGL